MTILVVSSRRVFGVVCQFTTDLLCSVSPTTTVFMNHKCLQNIRDRLLHRPVQILLIFSQ